MFRFALNVSRIMREFGPLACTKVKKNELRISDINLKTI